MKGNKLLSAACIAAALALTATPALAEMAKVAVSQIVEHPALDATRQGLLDGLKAKGYEEGKNLEFSYQTAQGNPAIAVQIAKQFVGEQPDVLVGIATPTAQALAAATRSIPVVFTAVTDPVGAKLVRNVDQPERNVTGLSDLSPVAQHVALVKEILPDAKRIGVVYNPGEANAVALVDLLRKAAREQGMEVVEGTALKSADVQSAAQIVASKADALYAPTDNTVASAVEGLVNAGNQAGIPVIGASTTYIESGALAALGFDYYQVGVQTADYVDALLKGKKVSELPVKVALGSDLALNQKVATKLNITFPQALVDRATSIAK
ncbi:ABC transporter substrate-binding protein [Photobacterium halotolerans]|uniref:ABC transporter substrate-binding protein n=1 Tax=Photobacterium halotolerans TaxID=265726 RepID=A0A7X4Y1L9_9GAMM|nr:ABC transporter substrate-binding protein [Photobacterium halotolerans]NAW64668.1 ABC transporter substrate-binding protein [Photobacterium halotolerans]NAW86269.1 ABC transporter substrate-binding protein [Photobacterium halotolerans]NAX49267.1 ABC transporter substrate-binding protein [Photobacterium halotolerans]